MNREFVMLAKTLDDRTLVSNMYASIKLDGQRCLWDGGISRGLLKARVPWANNNKDQRYVEPPIATGLWTRYGNVIHAPPWFLDLLPKDVFLDGELYLGRGLFQECRTIVSPLVPDGRWERVKFHVFDIVPPTMLASSGIINNPQFSKKIQENDCMDFIREHIPGVNLRVPQYYQSVQALFDLWRDKKTKVWMPLTQTQLPSIESVAREKLMEMLHKETSLGGEGIMLRAPGSVWSPKRSPHLVKVKKLEIDEGRVIGYYSGTGKLKGMMGSMVVEWNGKTFQLSGFTDAERSLRNGEMMSWALSNQSELCPDWIESAQFRRGATVRFTYRTLTDDGIPREARYVRS